MLITNSIKICVTR